MVIDLYGLWYWRLKKASISINMIRGTRMNLHTSSIMLNSNRQFIYFRHALYCVLEGSLALSLCSIRMHRYNRVNFKSVPVSHVATLQMLA